jgi:SulP family sulfate permease
MIFGVAKAINREHNAVKHCDAVILDLSDVPHVGVTSSLAIENAIDEAIEKGRHVFLVGATGQIKRRFERMGLFKRIPAENLVIDRADALQRAVALVRNGQSSPVKLPTSTSTDVSDALT